MHILVYFLTATPMQGGAAWFDFIHWGINCRKLKTEPWFRFE
jgi:hypothetical protein